MNLLNNCSCLLTTMSDKIAKIGHWKKNVIANLNKNKNKFPFVIIIKFYFNLFRICR